MQSVGNAAAGIRVPPLNEWPRSAPAGAPTARLIGSSPAMTALAHQIQRVAPTRATVLIVGESGTGKELVARAIHDLSRRRDGPYLPVNCAAIAAPAGDHADPQTSGPFERAIGGTVFLDAVSEMPAEVQTRLQRLLDNESIDLRFVAATNRSPDQAIEQGRLRPDLYFRLNVVQITLPPLRERPDDIEPLANHFLAQSAAALDSVPKRLRHDALKLLQAYRWPGNVRELKNALHSAFILAGSEITPDSLPQEIQSPGSEAASALTIPIGMTAAEAERRLIIATLAHFDGRKWMAAEALGLSLKTLYNRLQRYSRLEDQP